MAKLALQTLAVFIALFFTISTSKPQQHTHDLPDDDSATFHFHKPSITLPEPESKRTILLPSEKPDSEPATMVELEQNEKEIEALEMVIVEEDEVVEEKKKPEMRMAYRDLRPVWPRSVDQRMMFVLRHHHRCRHPHRRPQHQPHHQILFRQFDIERPGVEIRETERLIADPEMEQDLTEIYVGDVVGRRHAPSRWVRFHFGGKQRFPDDPNHELGPRHHDQDEDHRQDEEERRNHHRDEDDRRQRSDEKRPFGGRREKNGGGLMRRFRKFLHLIDF